MKIEQIKSYGKSKLLSKGFIAVYTMIFLLPCLLIIFSPLLYYFPYNYENFPRYLTILITITVISCFIFAIYAIFFGNPIIEFLIKKRLVKIILNRPDSIVNPINCKATLIRIINLNHKGFWFDFAEDFGLLYIDSAKKEILIECGQSRMILKAEDISNCIVIKIDANEIYSEFDLATFYIIKIAHKDNDFQLQELHIACVHEFGVSAKKNNLKKAEILSDQIQNLKELT